MPGTVSVIVTACGEFGTLQSAIGVGVARGRGRLRPVALCEIGATALLASPITFDDWKTTNDAFEDLAAFRYWESANLEDATAEQGRTRASRFLNLRAEERWKLDEFS